MSDSTLHNNAQQAHDEEHDGDHIVPVKVYVAVFLSLIALTWVTTFVSTVDLGSLNIVVALAIAVFKASLVLFFFMHVKYAKRLTKTVISSAIYFLLLLGIALTDIFTRNWMGVPGR